MNLIERIDIDLILLRNLLDRMSRSDAAVRNDSEGRWKLSGLITRDEKQAIEAAIRSHQVTRERMAEKETERLLKEVREATGGGLV